MVKINETQPNLRLLDSVSQQDAVCQQDADTTSSIFGAGFIESKKATIVM